MKHLANLFKNITLILLLIILFIMTRKVWADEPEVINRTGDECCYKDGKCGDCLVLNYDKTHEMQDVYEKPYISQFGIKITPIEDYNYMFYSKKFNDHHVIEVIQKKSDDDFVDSTIKISCPDGYKLDIKSHPEKWNKIIIDGTNVRKPFYTDAELKCVKE